MEIEYKGGNCVVLTHKKDEYVIDPRISDLGLKDQGAHATAVLLTQQRFEAPVSDDALVITGPGEYEVHNCSIKGVAARPHTAADDAAPTATMYSLQIEDTNVVVLGHIAPKLNTDQLEALGVVDILVVPVGGYGYTLDPKDAVTMVRSIEPKVVIPTHYAEDGVTYEVPQAQLEEFVKELGVAMPDEAPTKLKYKSGQLPESLTLVRLTRTK